MTDMEILIKAYHLEQDPRVGPRWHREGWSALRLGTTAQDLKRLAEEGLIELVNHVRNYKSYRLAEKGKGLVAVTVMEEAKRRIPAAEVLVAFNLIVGFDDLKEAIAGAVESGHRIHFMLSGPPACAKTLLLEGVRQVVPGAFMAFGSRTTAAGLSDALFENRPSVLLLDEADKMRWDVYSVLLGLMEHGEVLETKSRQTRGIKLETMVMAACNSSAKMPKEFLSRFSMHADFPPYTRQEFIDVCRGFLSQQERCDSDLAAFIGEMVYDRGLGDVRKARGIWQLMNAPTEAEAVRVAQMMIKYSPHRRAVAAAVNGRLNGM